MGGRVLRVSIREVFPDGRPAAWTARDVAPDQTVSVGRDGELELGVAAPDDGISRQAATVSAADRGWDLHLTNRNGAMLHLWAQAPVWLTRDSRRLIRWPRVAVRFVGHEQDVEHWLLLEADGYPLPTPGLPEPSANDTLMTKRPREITASQLEAIRTTFHAHLAWPPVVGPAARSLEAVAHRLGVTPSAVRERLRPVQDRARDLGLHDQLGVTEPDYLYHLAAHGYLADVPPPAGQTG